MSYVESQLVPTVTQSHTVAYRTLLVMFCVLKFYFVGFYGMFTSSPTWRLKMHVLCKVGKILFFKTKHKTLLENSEDSLASSCVEFSIGLSCKPVSDWVTHELAKLSSLFSVCSSFGLSCNPL